MSYYVYLNKEVKGPFTLSTLQENLNAGLWDPDTLCCLAGKGEWTPLALLFQVKFVPVQESLVEKVTKKTQEIALRAFRASPFKGLVAMPPNPSTTNIVRIQTVVDKPLPEVPSVSSSQSAYPPGVAPGPTGLPRRINVQTNLIRSQAPLLPSLRQPGSPGVPQQTRRPAPVVTGREGLGPEHYAMILGILAIGWGLYYILIKAIYPN